MKKILALLLLTASIAGAQQQVINYSTQPSGTVIPETQAWPKVNANFGQVYGMFGSTSNFFATGTVLSGDIIGLWTGPCSTAGTFLNGQGVCAVPPGTGGGGGGGSAPAIGSYLAYASATGTVNNVAPAGFGYTVGRLDVTLAAGAATWTGLSAGTDGQIIILRNADATNSLSLATLNSSSLSANQFAGRASTITLTPGATQMLIYYGGSVNNWVSIP